MIEKIIEFSIRNRFLVLIVAAALTVAGVYAVLNTPVDAIPDLSENQVIVFTDWMGRSPREIEDQSPIRCRSSCKGWPACKAVRSSSEFNFSMITIIFEDDIDFYFARQRVTEKLAQAGTFLAAGRGAVPGARRHGARARSSGTRSRPSPSNPIDPARLWALNKFYIAPQLNAARGRGRRGDRRRHAAWNTRSTCGPKRCAPTASRWASCTRRSARATCRPAAAWSRRTTPSTSSAASAGSKTRATSKTPSSRKSNGTPIYVKTVASGAAGHAVPPQRLRERRQRSVGGAVLMRHGENPLAVTERIKEKIQELQPGLPAGVHIVPPTTARG